MKSTVDRSPVTSPQVLRTAVAAAHGAGKTVGLVPTMGALHAGHVSLVEAACRQCDFVVVTIFVNPTQFGPGEDFDRYPRSLDADLRLLGDLDVDIVFAPTRETMYAASHGTSVDVGPVALPLEGECRPVHFRGVATVVLKLFHLVAADVAYFGQKDFQQSLVVRQMVSDLNVPVDIRVCPIVRESDGLALSSRNRYLSPEQRRQALVLSRSLREAAAMVAGGEHRAAMIRGRMEAMFEQSGVDRIDYIALADPETLRPVEHIERKTVVLVAAYVGDVRLIDNALVCP